MRELDKGQPLTVIAAEIEVSYRTALRMAQVVRQELYAHRSALPRLSGEVEGDDIHVKSGQ